MSFMFATCDRRMALGFLRKLYPSRTVEDSPEDAGPLLDLVEADVVRIPDPMMHGSRVGVMPSKNYTAERHDEIFAVCKAFHDGASHDR